MNAPRNVPPVTESDESKVRFQVELEFVQCLANPRYCNFLAQRGYFKEQNFINYLKYLLYWRDPQYAKFLKYPQCLHMLELLQYEHFRAELMNTQCAKFIDEQQLLHWQHYTRKRFQLLNQQAAHAASKASAEQPNGEQPNGESYTQQPADGQQPSGGGGGAVGIAETL